jgi:hypothetical protein
MNALDHFARKLQALPDERLNELRRMFISGPSPFHAIAITAALRDMVEGEIYYRVAMRQEAA